MADAAQTLGRGVVPALPRGKPRAHSRLVRVARWVLPMLMVAVIAGLAGLVIAHAVRRDAAAHMNAAAPIRMINPVFFGRDNQGRAFTLRAHQAARDESSFQTVRLWQPAMNFDVGGAHPSAMTADQGVYHEDTRILTLTGHVRADNAQTSQFATDEAVVNTRTGVVTGSQSLAGQTPSGQVNSQSFNVFDKGDRVIFKGGVHARLNGQPK